MQNKNLGWFRRKFFPVHNNEMRSVVLFNILFFLAAGSYGMLRAMKETYVTAVAGSQLVLWVKFVVVIPTVIFLKYLYDTIGSRTSMNNCVYAMMGYFLVFFLVFKFVLFPYFADPTTSTAIVKAAKDAKRKLTTWEILSVAKAVWPSILFYAHAEGYGTFAIGVITWGFANRVVSKQQSPRWYVTFCIGTGLATILAGLVSLYLFDNLGWIFGAICTCIALFILVYYYFNKKIQEDPEKLQVFPKKQQKKKKKLGFLASIRALLASKERRHL
ncbi:MAG: Npt1/Npt2 family nucleotide transporter, partial [Cytophagales bacterium]